MIFIPVKVSLKVVRKEISIKQTSNQMPIYTALTMVFLRPESNKVVSCLRIEQSPDWSPVASKPLSYGSSPGRLTRRNTLSVTLVRSYVELYPNETLEKPGYF